VLHVSQSVEGGVAYVVEDYILAQVAVGLEVHVACPAGALAVVAEKAGAAVHLWNAVRDPSPRALPRELWQLRRILADVAPDLVHLHSAKAGLVGRLALRGRRPTVFTPHAWSWHAVDGPTRVAVRAYERAAVRWTDVITCVSEAEREQGLAEHIRGDLRLLVNDLNPSRVRAEAPADRGAARALLGVPEGADLLVCCARLAPQKGQDVLLAAWPVLQEAMPDAQLVLVGGGPCEPELAAQAEGLKGVTLVGAQERPRALAWMSAADLVVCPSRYEGMSLVPLEAAVLGRCVVASRVEGMDEGPGEPARTLVPVGDPAALAEAIMLAFHSARMEQGEREALSWSDSAYGSQRSDVGTLQLYAELCPSRFSVARAT
jgi:glycosyltransferase involved in cell wall biosynthesis